MIRFIVATLALLATLSTASAFDIKNMTDEERAAFRDAVRSYLLDNPEVIFEAAAIYEERQAAEQASNDQQLIALNAKAIFDDGVSYVGGNPEGDITVVEFLDYRCGYCKRAFADVRELIASDGNIRFVVKEFPILGEQSTLASRFAISTRLLEGDEAYIKVHDELMVLRGEVNPAALNRIADRVGIDFEAVVAGMEDPAINDELRANQALAQMLSINGTPSFIFQDEMVRGYAPLDAMREIVAGVRG